MLDVIEKSWLGDDPVAGEPSPVRPVRAVRKLGHQTAADILAKELPPVSFIVPGYLSEGLTILAGRPKLGKSWMSLGLAIAVATNGLALGSIKVKPGSVLYLALEDNERRLQQRLKQLRPEGTKLDALFIETECPRLDEGGVEAIREWVLEIPDARLVIIDVFNKVRSQKNTNDTPYEADYRALGPLKTLADEHSIAILVVHHVRKMKAEDPFDMVSGTTGFTGAADTILILDKGSRGDTLYGRGRDIEEIETALAFDRSTGSWTAVGPASEVRRSDEREAILSVLKQAEGPMSPAKIADVLDVSSNNIRQLLKKMAEAGEVETQGRGQYICAGGAQTSPDTDNNDHMITPWDEDD